MRYALIILKQISLYSYIFGFVAFFLMGSVHTGAAYSSCGSTAPLCIVFSSSCFIPQLILANLDNAFISLVHLYFICLLNLNLLSIIVPKYLGIIIDSKFKFNEHIVVVIVVACSQSIVWYLSYNGSCSFKIKLRDFRV